MHVRSTARVTSVRLGWPFATMLVLAACSGGGASTPPSNAPIGVSSASSSSSSAVAADPSALDALDRAERTLATAAGNCAAACEALGDIVAARAKLCTPKSDACDDARTREADARRTTDETCGDCAGSD